jgi:hypothetical protein
MHMAAKLNVFFGVRNFRIEFLPHHLHFLGKLLVKRPINAFFPISVGIASIAALVLLNNALAPDASAGQVIGSLFLCTIILLGVLENWLLVLPLPATLWGWGIRPLPTENDGEGEGTHRPPHRSSHLQGAPLRAIPERVMVKPLQSPNES